MAKIKVKDKKTGNILVADSTNTVTVEAWKKSPERFIPVKDKDASGSGQG